MANNLLRNLTLIYSPEQQAQDEAALYSRVFPFGAEQKAAVEQILAALCPAGKRKASAQLFAYISLADAYLTAKPDMRDAAVRKWDRESRFIPEKARRVIIALLLRTVALQDMADFPAAEDVRALAESDELNI